MNIKSLIRSNYYGQLLILRFHQIESVLLPKLIGDKKAVEKYFHSITGQALDLENPTTFTEKLNWYKLHVHDPLMSQCADKYSVRGYVTEMGFEDILNELYAVYKSVEEIDFGSLPDQFILKAAHGSHMNLVVKDKSKINWRREKRVLSLWLKQDIYWSGREWVYKDIPKRIIAEKYLGDALTDYKFYCFNGIPRYLDVDIDRYTNHVRNYYDMEWNYIPMKCSFVRNDPDAVIEKPQQFEKMKLIAEKLSKPFQFVRVDLYEVDGRVYFGELTFYQDGGFPGYSEEYDRLIGSYWELKEFPGHD